MTEARGILQALRDCGTSTVVRYLVPDYAVPSVAKAVALHKGTEPGAAEAFHRPRLVRNGDGVPHFAFVVPEERGEYRTLVQSERALKDLGLRADQELEAHCQGSRVYHDEQRGIFPYALAYAGHQFGVFAGQLGDGRVANLYDIRDSRGRYQTLQLKGSGMTPFSRFADGKAVLRSSVREFIVSEALAAIGIPSTRALQLTLLPKTRARRTMFEPCAVVARFAPSWIRLGNFDMFRWRGDDHGLLQLVDYCIQHVFAAGREFPTEISVNAFQEDFFPDPLEKIPATDELPKAVAGVTTYDLFFRHVVNLNAECVAYWQAYGFCNGVLNTDNTSLMGLSMDFGPFSFMDKYRPEYTPNHDDIEGRYSFSNQPYVIWWNLTKFAEALVLLLGSGEQHIGFVKTIPERSVIPENIADELGQRVNALVNCAANEYRFRYHVKYAEIMAKRLGIQLNIPLIQSDNLSLIAERVRGFMDSVVNPLLDILSKSMVDYNSFFVALQEYQGPFHSTAGVRGVDPAFLQIFFTEEDFQLLTKHANGVSSLDPGTATQFFDLVEKIDSWLINYLQSIPEREERYRLQKLVNPLFIPRSYVFDEVLEELEKMHRNVTDANSADIDTTILTQLYTIATNPYDRTKWYGILDDAKIKAWTEGTTNMPNDDYLKQCSCSS
ncbi:AFL123Wp [Eremothecium gossypii ATCC 10895]|uniref:Selenoprotein O n=1 Tax=Eremothecium gossypii (strain ATCC 10895 / CBS 109.51 / FGSC 9923 / NRRL Y-1056) TaxID=284811 RepID=Q755E6_EREGS|nr:AFL123Wp [Eremothecium gossypii ATCC 10895]AAS53251.2 AFL123Wp [Eremothecium gossypii ATCC 10895]